VDYEEASRYPKGFPYSTVITVFAILIALAVRYVYRKEEWVPLPCTCKLTMLSMCTTSRGKLKVESIDQSLEDGEMASSRAESLVLEVAERMKHGLANFQEKQSEHDTTGGTFKTLSQKSRQFCGAQKRRSVFSLRRPGQEIYISSQLA
jgi:hypothetical protein